LEHFILVWLLYEVWFKKIFGVTLDNRWRTLRATSDNWWRLSAPPQTTGGDTPRRPGQQARSLRADPDGAESRKSSLPPHCMKKYFQKVDTTNHYHPRREIMAKKGG